jgi:AraC-like DNA-binding protein
MIPFAVLGVLHIFYPEKPFMNIAAIYILALYVLFSVYMAFAVRTYGRWLNDNYADLENKRVWLSQVVSFFCLLLFILYALVDTESVLIYFLHIVELVLFALLLWRVETLPQLGETLPQPLSVNEEKDQAQVQEPSTPLTDKEEQGAGSATIDFTQIEQLLQERCIEGGLYLQHDLSLLQLAQSIGTNRYYLSQYFSRKGFTYNAYINDLRIKHFMRLYDEALAAHQHVVAQHLASESGYRSYSTFSLAFKQRVGETVSTWMNSH